MAVPVTYNSQWLSVQINPDKNEVVLQFLILGKTFKIIDNSINFSTLRVADHALSKIARRIHDNIMIDGLLYKDVNGLLINMYKSKLWRFIK